MSASPSTPSCSSVARRRRRARVDARAAPPAPGTSRDAAPARWTPAAAAQAARSAPASRPALRAPLREVGPAEYGSTSWSRSTGGTPGSSAAGRREARQVERHGPRRPADASQQEALHHQRRVALQQAQQRQRRSSKSPTDAGSRLCTSTYWSCSAWRSSCASTSWLAGVRRRSAADRVEPLAARPLVVEARRRSPPAAARAPRAGRCRAAAGRTPPACARRRAPRPAVLAVEQLLQVAAERRPVQEVERARARGTARRPASATSCWSSGRRHLAEAAQRRPAAR